MLAFVRQVSAENSIHQMNLGRTLGYIDNLPNTVITYSTAVKLPIYRFTKLTVTSVYSLRCIFGDHLKLYKSGMG